MKNNQESVLALRGGSSEPNLTQDIFQTTAPFPDFIFFSRVPVILIEDGMPYQRSSQVKEFQKKMEYKGLLFTYLLPSFAPDFN